MRLLLGLVLAVCAQGAVSQLHPRIYVRNDKAEIGHGLRVSELRARANGPWARWRRPVTLNNAAAAMEIAARYLEEGKAEDLKAVRDYLVAHTYSLEKNDVGGLLAGAEMMTAYDWIYNGLTPEDRALLAANLLKTCASSRHFIEHGGPDVNHNYLYMAMTTVATAGLVLSGEPEPAGSAGREYLALAQHWLEGPGLILDTWKAREGAWGEGSHYTFHETLRNLVLTLSAFRSASDQDYFATHALTMQQAAWFLIGNVRPDLTFVRTGDTQANRATVNLTVPVTIEMMAEGIPEASTQLHDLANDLITAYGPTAVHSLFGWGMRVFWSPDEPRTPSYRSLPRFERFGAGTMEQIVMRNGRGADSTHITIVAGNQFTDHQHFDKGQFLIYQRGGLTVDSGGYDGMYRPGKHANEYASRTVAHNALLVYDPAELMPKGYTNDGGQRVLRNKQHHSTWPQFLAHREREWLDAGTVTAVDHTDGYSYVRVDLSRAYSEKIASYQRLFTYLPAEDVLVVFDRVRTPKPFDQRWLLHFDTAPEVDGKTPAAGIQEYANARWTTVRLKGSYDRGGSVAQYNGALFTETLLPKAHDVITIGGRSSSSTAPSPGRTTRCRIRA